ncbi:MAG: hypothetical protein K2Y37_16815 [Pirellulales bacterium]|nr:hypothetical protein [Pirellulales bacterium]
MPDVKEVKEVCWDVKCEDFCVPGPSCCCGKVDKQDECGCWSYKIWKPNCGHVRTRKTLVKKEVTREVPTTKWVVENVCAHCKSACDVELPADGAPPKLPAEQAPATSPGSPAMPPPGGQPARPQDPPPSSTPGPAQPGAASVAYPPARVGFAQRAAYARPLTPAAPWPTAPSANRQPQPTVYSPGAAAQRPLPGLVD